MPPAIIAAGVSAAGAVGSGLIAKSGAKKAAQAQEDAARRAEAAQERRYQEQLEFQKPFREAGLTAQQEIMNLLGLGPNTGSAEYGSMAKAFGREQFQTDPGYQFRQSEGLKALERSAAARGKFMSGASMKGITRFGQDLASQEYQNAFNRYQTERAARLNPLQNLMGSGQAATNVMTGAAGQAGQAQAQNIYGAGQARASGYVGQANALAGALSGAANAIGGIPMYNAQMNYLNRGGYGGAGSLVPDIKNTMTKNPGIF